MNSHHGPKGSPVLLCMRGISCLLILLASLQMAFAQIPPAGGGGSARCRASGAFGTVADPSTGLDRIGGLGRTTCNAWAPCLMGESRARGAARATLGFATAFVRVQGSAVAAENCPGSTQVVLNANASYFVNIALVLEPPGGWPGGPVPLIVRGSLSALEDATVGGSASLTISGLGVSETWSANSDTQPNVEVTAALGMTFGSLYTVSLNATCVAGVGFSGGLDRCEATGDPSFEFEQATFDAMMGDDTFPLADHFVIEFSENLVATPLGVDVIKLTNLKQADGAYDVNVPQIPAGETVTWTYDVANMGEEAIAATDLVVTDSDATVVPVLDLATDDGDLILSPLETWEYTASAAALDLASPAPGLAIVTGCGDGRNTYQNTGRAQIAGTAVFDEHVGYYCNDVAVSDIDGDGIRDEQDNCVNSANGPVRPDAGGQSQLDTDADGIGNICDADLDNDCAVNFLDLAMIKSVFFSSDKDADFDGNAAVDFADLAIMKQLFFRNYLVDNPSGVPNACDGR